MSVGTTLQQEFRRHSAGKRGEVELFRAFIEAFNSLGPNCLAKEFHGQRHQVTFQQARGAGRQKARCELCDVLIIQYPESNPANARFTFNQVKVAATSLDTKALTGKKGYKFLANLEQWDLLAHRPKINPATSTFLPPKNLLSGALLPSVGSFGVFYPKNGSYDFAYFIAGLLGPIKNNPSRSGTLKWEHNIDEYRNFNSYSEVIGASCLKAFGQALQRGVVGTPILEYLDQSPDANVFRIWIDQILINLLESAPDSLLPNELRRILDLNISDRDRKDVNGSSTRAVVLIKTSQNEIGSGKSNKNELVFNLK